MGFPRVRHAQDYSGCKRNAAILPSFVKIMVYDNVAPANARRTGRVACHSECCVLSVASIDGAEWFQDVA